MNSPGFQLELGPVHRQTIDLNDARGEDAHWPGLIARPLVRSYVRQPGATLFRKFLGVPGNIVSYDVAGTARIFTRVPSDERSRAKRPACDHARRRARTIRNAATERRSMCGDGLAAALSLDEPLNLEPCSERLFPVGRILRLE